MTEEPSEVGLALRKLHDHSATIAAATKIKNRRASNYQNKEDEYLPMVSLRSGDRTKPSEGGMLSTPTVEGAVFGDPWGEGG